MAPPEESAIRAKDGRTLTARHISDLRFRRHPVAAASDRPLIVTAAAAQSLKTTLLSAFSWPCGSGCSAPGPGCRFAHAHLQNGKTNAQKAHAAFPVGIHLPPEAIQAECVTLETAHQHSDGDHQQQPIDPLRIPQATARQLEDPGFLISEQLFTAEPLGIAPDQIERRLSIADQRPGFVPVQRA